MIPDANLGLLLRQRGRIQFLVEEGPAVVGEAIQAHAEALDEAIVRHLRQSVAGVICGRDVELLLEGLRRHVSLIAQHLKNRFVGLSHPVSALASHVSMSVCVGHNHTDDTVSGHYWFIDAVSCIVTTVRLTSRTSTPVVAPEKSDPIPQIRYSNRLEKWQYGGPISSLQSIGDNLGISILVTTHIVVRMLNESIYPGANAGAVGTDDSGSGQKTEPSVSVSYLAGAGLRQGQVSLDPLSGEFSKDFRSVGVQIELLVELLLVDLVVELLQQFVGHADRRPCHVPTVPSWDNKKFPTTTVVS